MWLTGVVTGAFVGVLAGQWMTWLTLRNPLDAVIRAYRELFADIAHLCATGELRIRRLAPAPAGNGAPAVLAVHGGYPLGPDLVQRPGDWEHRLRQVCDRAHELGECLGYLPERRLKLARVDRHRHVDGLPRTCGPVAVRQLEDHPPGHWRRAGR
jgi:hypothetical protein